MTDTPPTPEEEAVDPPEPHPDYVALPADEQAVVDEILQNAQEMQNGVDRAIGVMGEPVFWMTRLLLQHDLMVRTCRRQIQELEHRLAEVEDRIS